MGNPLGLGDLRTMLDATSRTMATYCKGPEPGKADPDAPGLKDLKNGSGGLAGSSPSVRQTLLDGIRQNLCDVGLMSARGDVYAYRDLTMNPLDLKAKNKVKEFMEQAEKTLLGGAAKKDEDLDKGTAVELLKKLDELVKNQFELVRKIPPKATSGQVRAIRRLDPRSLAAATGLGERAAAKLEVVEVGKPAKDGSLVIRLSPRGGGKDKTDCFVTVSSAGEYLGIGANLQRILLNDLGTISDFLGMLKPEEYGLAEEFFRFFQSGADGAPGFLNDTSAHLNLASFNRVAPTLFASVLPSLREKLKENAPLDLEPFLREKLNLPTRESSKHSGLFTSRETAFLLDVRDMVCDEFVKIYHVPENVRKAFFPRSKKEWKDSEADERRDSPLPQMITRYGLLLQPFLQFEGLSFLDRIRFLEGKFTPKFEDFRTGGLKELTKSGNVTNKTLADRMKGISRYKGTKYYLTGEQIYEIGGDNPGGSMGAVDKLIGAGYKPEQIYQLTEYTNNGGVFLLWQLGLIGELRDVDVRIIHGEGDAEGDMRVCARFPRLRFLRMDVVQDPKDDKKSVVKVVCEQTKEYVEHEFVIHASGMTDAKGIRFGTDENREAKEIVVG